MAQDLAEENYEYHQGKNIPQITNIFNEKGVVDDYIRLPLQSYISFVISSKPTMDNGKIVDYKNWTLGTSEKENEVILSYVYQKPSGTMQVQVRSDSTETTREKVIEQLIEKHVKHKSDLDSDIFLA